MARVRIIVVVGLALAVVGCSTPLTTREKGALAGGAIGAGAGAAIGSQTGHAGTGALIGAGLGAVSGALIGDAIQGAEQKQAAQVPPSPPPPPAVVMTPLPPQVAIAVPPPVVAPAPRLIWVPAWGVYVLEGHDIVYYQGVYYYYYGSQWYVAQSHAGPWAIVGTPPPTLAKLPPGQFHKHYPPALLKKGKVPPGHMR